MEWRQLPGLKPRQQSCASSDEILAALGMTHLPASNFPVYPMSSEGHLSRLHA
jgi:hypothetical protein